ncbi:hypothetical protein GCM10027160_04880 [Streptomyces calidiresistens]
MRDGNPAEGLTDQEADTFPMAETYFSRPAGGVCHLHARHTENYIVLTNELITRATIGLTVAMGLYIMWAPEGTSVTIESLCARWREGRTLMSRALRELEEIGFLERRVEQGPDGRLTTRTIIHHRPRDLEFPPVGTAPSRPRTSRRPDPLAVPVEWVPPVAFPLATAPMAVLPDPAPMAPADVPAPAPIAEPARPADPGVAADVPPPPATGTGAPAAPVLVSGNAETPHPAPEPAPVPSGIPSPPGGNTPPSLSRPLGEIAAPENADPGETVPVAENPGGNPGGGKSPVVEPDAEPVGEAVMRVAHALRRRDPRLLLSERECRTLAPGITAWLNRGTSEAEVVRSLCQGLPTVLRGRAAGILAWRLREHLPPPAPVGVPAPVPLAPPAPAPVRGKPEPCRGCHDVLLRPEAGLTHCRACREAMTRAPTAA